MDSSAKKNRLGLVVGVGLTLLLLAGLFFGVEENPFRKPYLTFSIRFDDVTGVGERSKVTFLGIPAGYVKRLDYAPGSKDSAVRVDVVITRKLKIPENVRAYLEPTLLGDASIALRLPETGSASGQDPQGLGDQASNRGTLSDGAEIRGLRSTKLEAVMPGFDQALANLKNFAGSTEKRLDDVGQVVDRAVETMRTIFLEKEPNGRTEVEDLIATLREIINGPEGNKDASIKAQLETIVANLTASSANIRKLADVQSTEQGSIGQVIETFQEAAKKLALDAEIAQKLFGKIGHASDSVNQAGQQISTLAAKASGAVDQFNSRPLHYLTTTRPLPDRAHSSKPSASPKE
jgi:ABC-type transporter Mla subunit MlaD